MGDRYFNTRYGKTESILLYVNDGGSIGDNYLISSVENRLSGTFEIDLLVESVNNPPQIGSLQSVPTEVLNTETGQ